MSQEDGRSPLGRIRSSFSLKLLLLFLAVFVVIAAIGGVVYAQTDSALKESTEENMVQYTKLQANSTAEWVERTRDRTEFLAGSPELASGDEATVASRLAEEHEDAGEEVVAIHHFDLENDTVLASSESSVAAGAYSDAGVRWVEEGVQWDDGQATAITRPYDDPVTGAPSIAFVSEVPEGQGAVVLVVDLETRSNMFERPGTSEASFTHIVDDEGVVVMSHDEHQLFTQNIDDEDEPDVDSMGVMRGFEGETDYVQMPMGQHHNEMAMGFTRVPGTDWVIMTHVPAHEAFALQESITFGVGGLLLVALLGLTTVGVVVGRNTTRTLRDLSEQAGRLEEGDLDAEFETDRVDEFGQLYGAFDAMRLSLRDRLEELEATRQRITRMNEHLEAKADEYSGVMAACAEGDLTQRMDPDSENEAMREIATEFNRMVSSLEETTEQLATFAAEVAASTQQVNASAEEVRSASEQVTESIQEISEGADRQHEYLRETSQEMGSLSTATEQIAATSNQVADLAEQTAQAARDGHDAAQAAIEGMDEIGAESEAAVEEIEALEAEIEEIDELVEFIDELAEQTNVLALNASIEASRSTDETEDGFGVVADEVKELADKTKEATETIEDRIEAIKAQTDTSVEEVQQTSDRIAEQRDAVAETVDSLTEIAEYTNETSDGVQEISAATDQQAASTQEVVSMIQEATAISQETTAETENVAAAGEEQTTSITEVSHAINSLAGHAAHLSEELDEFDTDADVEQQPFEGGDGQQASSVDASAPDEDDGDPVAANVGSGSAFEPDEFDPDDFDSDAPDESLDDS